MNAIDLLTQQHRQVDELFEQIQQASGGERTALLEECAQALTMHATIEERIFYPAVKNDETEDLLKDSVNEHLEMKRGLAAILESEEDDEAADERLVSKLITDVQKHVEEEETALFPKVWSTLGVEDLERMGARMERLMERLSEEDDITERLDDEKNTPAQI